MMSEKSTLLLFGVDVVIALSIIFLLTYSVAALAPESGDDASVAIQYAALTP